MDLKTELEWEHNMVDAGVAKYHAAVDAAKYREVNGNMKPAKDESATSYGVALIREHFEEYEAYIAEFIKVAYATRGRRDIAAAYIARCDLRTVAYISARCIIDTISKEENQTGLIFRIAGRLEDQMRLIRFDDAYPRYYKTLLDDMQDRGIKDYRRKRKTLVVCHDKAESNAEQPEWIRWPEGDKTHIGATLIDLFIQATGLVTRISKRMGNKTSYWIKGTEYAIDLIQANMELFQFLHPEYMPCLIEPKDWSTPMNGGFWSPELRARRPLVKIKGFSRKEHTAVLMKAKMPMVYEAVNAAQRVAWQVNEFVMEQAREELNAKGIGCPVGMNQPAPISPYPLPDKGDMTEPQYEAMLVGIRANRTPDEIAELAIWRAAMRDWHHRQISSKAKMLGIFNTYKIAKMLAMKERFYYVHTLDSRGRLYPCGVHLNPQGTGLAKGMLQFADGQRLGAHGYWHLCIHAAGVFGIDKVSLEERVAWVHSHHTRIIATWAAPGETREFWGAADKPYMFLAACKELAEIFMEFGTKMLTIVNKEGLKGYGSTYESKLPCAQDGSCNGIQHFSAMLRDPVGAKAVNMTDSGEVQDIYGQTAEEAERLMRADMADEQVFFGKDHKAMTKEDRYYMTSWLDDLQIDRKVCKRSTMIIPYGGQKSSCLSDVNEVLTDKLEDKMRDGQDMEWDSNDCFHAGYLMHNYVWAALDTVVVAARKAMKFLGACATIQNRTGRPMQWTTPLGYPCFQDYKNTKGIEVKTKISGQMNIWYSMPTDALDKNRMRNAFPPNFVHSMDATHLMMVVNASLDVGIDQFALVHDSYGVPAGRCETFHAIIREQFVKLYDEDRLYNLLKEQRIRNPEQAHAYPGMDTVEPGDFELKGVNNAPHFFR